MRPPYLKWILVSVSTTLGVVVAYAFFSAIFTHGCQSFYIVPSCSINQITNYIVNAIFISIFYTAGFVVILPSFVAFIFQVIYFRNKHSEPHFRFLIFSVVLGILLLGGLVELYAWYYGLVRGF